MSREHVVSLRLNDKEIASLRVVAVADDIPVSEVIRRLIRREHAAPLACGQTMGSPVRFIETSAGWLSPDGITWCTGQTGGTLTIGA